MNLDDPRAIVSHQRYDDAVKTLALAGTPRYRAGRHPAKSCFTVFDAVPRENLGEDVEGVGWVWWPQPRQLPSTSGSYRYLADAEASAETLNRTFAREAMVIREQVRQARAGAMTAAARAETKAGLATCQGRTICPGRWLSPSCFSRRRTVP